MSHKEAATALLAALEEENVEVMRELLQGPALKNRADRARDRKGTTALGVAAYHGKIHAMQLLLEFGADADAENLDGATPLSMAAFGKQADAAALLCVYCGDDLDIDSAIGDAGSTGAKQVVEVLEAYAEGSTDHPLLVNAIKLHEQSLPALRELAQEAAAKLGSRLSATLGAKNAFLRARTSKLALLDKQKEGDDLKPEGEDEAGVDWKAQASVWRQRAEKAEARVRELEAASSAGSGSASRLWGSDAPAGKTAKPGSLAAIAEAAAKPLEAQFAGFDTDGSGKLSKEELVAILTRPGGPAKFEAEQCEELFALIDLDGDGMVDIAEFCAACADGMLDG